MIQYTVDSINTNVGELKESWKRVQEILCTYHTDIFVLRILSVKDRIQDLETVSRQLASQEATSTDRINERLCSELQSLMIETERLCSILTENLQAKLEEPIMKFKEDLDRIHCDSESLAGEVESFHGIMEDSFHYGLEEDDSYYSG